MQLFFNALAGAELLWRARSVMKRAETEFEAAVVKPLETILAGDGEGAALIQRVRRYMKKPMVGFLEYASLTGREVSPEALLALAWISASTPIYDHFFDGPHASQEGIARLELILSGRNLAGAKPVERAMELGLENIQRFLPSGAWEQMHDYLLMIHQAQKAEFYSRAIPDKDNLWRITTQKGGYAVLVGVTPIVHPIPPTEESILYQIGVFGQFLDDFKDVGKDKARGIPTLVTEGFIDEAELAAQRRKTELAVRTLGLPPKETRRFLFMFDLYFSMSLASKRKYESGVAASRLSSGFQDAIPLALAYIGLGPFAANKLK